MNFAHEFQKSRILLNFYLNTEYYNNRLWLRAAHKHNCACLSVFGCAAAALPASVRAWVTEWASERVSRSLRSLDSALSRSWVAAQLSSACRYCYCCCWVCCCTLLILSKCIWKKKLVLQAIIITAFPHVCG